ncbi:hypothetical protein HRM2_25880 [Desulforapulum autotrophicum HRM2]|uniref:Uncharacterized protein n=1 Tax=Desulforapulum autotrophicum (strain ATCC 43914 / DSM 3382 / VKM B-1955 / HRM2) TaxID=177437 RepID=C0QH33_DESAH|nr:hypothetical protein [Desulforapulum autotrophicum]ACN15682.1 hypothetical protein HRM2_25880 [Desulforapulum autotrophicum HRM2]
MKTKKVSTLKKGSTPAEKRETERRQEAAKGYTYITTVGWICRRERARRKNDSFMF